MNEITEKLTKLKPSIALDLAHEQTVNALQSLYDLAQSIDRLNPEAHIVAKKIIHSADQISIGCKNIYVSSTAAKNEALLMAADIVEGWQSLANSAVSAMDKLVDKYESKNIS